MACSRGKLSYLILVGEGITENNENVTSLQEAYFTDFQTTKERTLFTTCMSLSVSEVRV